MIQTHAANQRCDYPDIPISIFRKDVDLSEGIVPLVQFTVIQFDLITSRIKRPPLPPHCTVTKIRSENVHVFMDVLYDMTKELSFDIFILPEVTTLEARIEGNQWFVYTMQCRDTILAIYMFRDTNRVH